MSGHPLLSKNITHTAVAEFLNKLRPSKIALCDIAFKSEIFSDIRYMATASCVEFHMIASLISWVTPCDNFKTQRLNIRI